MKLINSNEFKEKLNYLNYELYNSHHVGELSKEEKDIVSQYIYHISNMVDNMPAENVIPVEWIKGWIDNISSNPRYKVIGEIRNISPSNNVKFAVPCVSDMLKDWEKGNGRAN